ncbi:hypothetical protein BU25DRAFT_130476 [Macroventuria anomochaeta]|uniref:Uncharacterized protein n=1 Tax=Macroventuria anomochaeta TaxID=301207 RepID=A0ACB6RV71_9PLEO|nr:uncharacterized protein BU25DRAFT_130476 [Macroventuria anomochaeta]KAF2624998.1 hypothetical protein BU25DRAFT_130476 [Macroventuria anomochaeta]
MRVIHLYRTELPMRRSFQALLKPPFRSSERLCRRCIFPNVSQPGHTLLSCWIAFVCITQNWSPANSYVFAARIGRFKFETTFLDHSTKFTFGKFVWSYVSGTDPEGLPERYMAVKVIGVRIMYLSDTNFEPNLVPVQRLSFFCILLVENKLTQMAELGLFLYLVQSRVYVTPLSRQGLDIDSLAFAA